MNHLLTQTYNIDTTIQDIQEYLYDNLTDRWTGNIDGYGRVYKNKDEKGNVKPEVYVSSNKKYKDVLYNGISSFFFIDGDIKNTLDGYMFTTKTKIVFMLNLDSIKNSNERVDADVQRDVVELVRKQSGVFTISNIETGVENVFRGFDINLLQEDMQPFHVFAVVGDLSYFINDKCN